MYYNKEINYAFSDTSNYPEHNILLKERNLIWLPNIIKSINRNKTFIAVGLNHLRFKYGLIELLRREGYIVDPVFTGDRR